MVSVLGLDDSAIDSLLAECNAEFENAEDQLCVANYLAPGNRAIGGSDAALARLQELAMARGAKKATRLRVAGAFHTLHMAEAADALREALDSVELHTPRIPVLSNVSGEPYKSAEEVRASLVRHLTEPVRWQQSIECMLRPPFDIASFIELSSSSVLSGLMRHILRRVKKEEQPNMAKVEVTSIIV